MRRLSLPLVILGCIALAALLAWIAVSRASAAARRPAARAPGHGRTQPLARFADRRVRKRRREPGARGSRKASRCPGEPREQGARDGRGARRNALHRVAQPCALVGHRPRQSRQPPPIVVTFRNVDAIAVAGTVKITAAKLRAEQLHVSGAGGTSLRIDDLDARDLKVSGAGALRADLAGRAAEATITISGAGEFRGAQARHAERDVTVAGAGKVTVNAREDAEGDDLRRGSRRLPGRPQGHGAGERRGTRAPARRRGRWRASAASAASVNGDRARRP